jgi:glycosyltransferase involved in cell wall biosynthesis
MLEFARLQADLLVRGLRRVDAVYVRAHFAAFPTALAAKLLRIPVVQEVNGPFEDLFIAWPWTRRIEGGCKWLARTQLRWADALVVVTPGYEDWVEREVGTKWVNVIPNAANTDLFRPHASTSQDLPHPYIIFFGALAEWQGLDVLLAATERPEWPEEVSLVIVGDGVGEGKVREAAARNHRVRYLGRIPYEEMPGVIAGSLASISVQTNLEERASLGLYPLKVFESLACGVPVIVSDYPGQADLVREHRCGLVIPSGDAAALARSVATLYGDPGLRGEMAHRGREIVAREHSWQRRAEQTDHLLRLILANGSQPAHRRVRALQESE